MKKSFSALLLCAALLGAACAPASALDWSYDLPVDATAFTDAAEIGRWDVVATLAQLDIISGKDDGAFHPTDTLTRAEAAKFYTHIFLGSKYPFLEEWGTPSFSDTQGHWAEPYIAFCVNRGILCGRSDQIFDPDAEVTGVEFLKMALSALGFVSTSYQLTGPAWDTHTIDLAQTREPLYEELDGLDPNLPLTRDYAAQILYNAIRATPKVVVGHPLHSDEYILEDFDGVPPTLLNWVRGDPSMPAVPAQPGKP